MKSKTIYWMSRAIRVEENPALQLAVSLANKYEQELEVHFVIQPDYPYANRRNMHFLLSGVAEVAQKLAVWNIPVIVKTADPLSYFTNILEYQSIDHLVTEHHVLRYFDQLHKQISKRCKEHQAQFYRINTACVVDVWQASDKLEFAARTFRPKIMAQYKKYLPNSDQKIKALQQKVNYVFSMKDVDEIMQNHPFKDIPISLMPSGEDAANEQLDWFIEHGLNVYHLRNEYFSIGQSQLSAYLHFGMISIRKVIRKVEETRHFNAAQFVEEAMVRRELAENYCYYQPEYDSLAGAWPWAQETLKRALDDEREYIYSKEEFELAQTHDDLWNFCQKQVVNLGYLHSYLRMYWAKMVLYWTKSPQEAIDILIYLNDTYFLDGRDPNGYTGIMWSVAGVHDRPWFTKPVTGLVRSMSKSGTMKKTRLSSMDLLGDLHK